MEPQQTQCETAVKRMKGHPRPSEANLAGTLLGPAMSWERRRRKKSWKPVREVSRGTIARSEVRPVDRPVQLRVG